MKSDVSSAANNLIAGTFTKYLLLAFNIGTGIFLMPFTVHHLGQTEYGLWMLVASMTYYFQLLDMGYGNGVVRHIVAADRRGDIEEVNRIASTFVCVYAAIGIAACAAIGGMIVWVVPRFPHLSPEQVRTAQALMAILGVRVALGFPMTVFGAVTNARQGFVLNNGVAIVAVLANAAFTYIVLERGHGLVMLVAVTTALNILGYGGYAWTARHVFPELRIRARYFSRKQWREVTTFSVYLFVIQIASQISFNIDNIVIGAVMGTAAVAVYTVALRLADYQRRLCDQFSGMLFSVAVGFGAEGNVAALRQTLVEGTRVAVTLVVGASVCLVGFSGPLIRHWMGAEFDGSVAPFVVLAAAGVIVVSQAAVGNVLIAVGSHKLLAAVWLGEALVNLPVSLYLVHRMGLVGVAVGTLTPLAWGHLGVLLPRACRAVHLPIRKCLADTFWPAIAGGAVAVAVCVLLRVALPPLTTRVVLLEASATGVAYAVGVYVLGFSQTVRARYVSVALEVFRSVRHSTPVIPPAELES
ncbi:MAG TPA: oligosaccharide flippase family protein [Vicinamibacterales bacterium]|nr:oligosaccharide flippase family protein [Vicinamibacterales bacterium]